MSNKIIKKADYSKSTPTDKQYVLVKDLVIPKGTVFGRAASKVEHVSNDHIEAIFGLSKDTCGTVVYCLGDDIKDPGQRAEIESYFVELKR